MNIRLIIGYLVCCLTTAWLSAQEPKSTPKDTSGWKTGEISASKDACVISFKLDGPAPKPGETAKLSVTLKPEKGWHLYEQALDGVTHRSKSGLPILFYLAPQKGITIAPLKSDIEAHEGKDLEGNTVYSYDTPVTLTYSIVVAADAPVGDIVLQGGVGIQLCDEGSSCLPPDAYEFDAKLAVGGNGSSDVRWNNSKYGTVKGWFQNKGRPGWNDPKPATGTKPPATGSSGVTPPAMGGNTPPTIPPAVPLSSVATTLPDWEPQTDDVQSLWGAVGFGLVGGFLLNFMPCVLPVIGLKLLSFVEQAGHERGRILKLNLVYVAGILTVFVILGWLAAVNNLTWGKQFQSLGFNIVMISLVFVMALSFLGVWEIPIPGFATSKSLTQTSMQKGYQGAYVKGIVTTLLATPCSGPFLGAVFAYAAKQPPLTVVLVFLSIGIGMSMPYMLIGAFPALIKFLPKQGAWMDTFKHIMGFVLLGTVLFLFMNLNADYFLPTLGLLFALWFAFWWIGRVPVYESLSKKIQAWGLGGAVAAVLGWGVFALLGPGKSQDTLAWKDYNPAELLAATNSGKTVILDLTADWCQTCKANLKLSIDRSAVKQLVEQNGVVAIKADFTEESDETNELLKKLNSESIPVLAIFPADNPLRPIVLRDLVTQSQVLNALRRAGPSKESITPVAAPSNGTSSAGNGTLR